MILQSMDNNSTTASNLDINLTPHGTGTVIVPSQVMKTEQDLQLTH
jgi:hypothetical protein